MQLLAVAVIRISKGKHTDSPICFYKARQSTLHNNSEWKVKLPLFGNNQSEDLAATINLHLTRFYSARRATGLATLI